MIACVVHFPANVLRWVLFILALSIVRGIVLFTLFVLLSLRWVLFMLAFMNADNRAAIAAAGAIEPLVALARDGSEGAKDWAAGALGMLAANNADNEAKIVAAGAIEPLMAVARGGSEEGKAMAAGALEMLAAKKDEKEAMGRLGYMP